MSLMNYNWECAYSVGFLMLHITTQTTTTIIILWHFCRFHIKVPTSTMLLLLTVRNYEDSVASNGLTFIPHLVKMNQ